MNTDKYYSLSGKIVTSISVVAFLILAIIFLITEKINKEAFYKVEVEKATIILDTLEPLLAISLFLDINNNIEKLARNLQSNPNVVSVEILRGQDILYASNKTVEKKENYFLVEKKIFAPNSMEVIGKVKLIYSSDKYKELMNKYRAVATIMAIIVIALLLLLSLYIKKHLAPLVVISQQLKGFTPKQSIHIPYIEENNEIRLVFDALIAMQENIFLHSVEQESINARLAELVDEKTRKLKTQLYTNPLTGLANRLSLVNDLNFFNNGALIIININDFKEINDLFGHLIGDVVLRHLGDRLGRIYENDLNIEIKHLQADEFALFFREKPMYTHFIKLINDLVLEIESMVILHDSNDLGIHVSIGATIGEEISLEKADIALTLAKNLEKSYIIYDENLKVEKKYKNNIQWIKNLKNALNEDNIVPFYQPIYDNKTGKIVSCECLIRLIDDEGNVVLPYKFLPAAKQSKVYNKLTKLMIEKSCKYFEFIDCSFSINLTIADMLDKRVLEYIKVNVSRYNVADKLTLEILETEGIENYEDIHIFIDAVKSLGCKIAIDDFGSGYSSLEYILKLNIDYIKIDGSLIKELETDKNAAIISETIVDFAKKLGVLTVAEFVHNEGVLQKVIDLDINRSQGFHLSEPQAQIKDFILENHKSLN